MGDNTIYKVVVNHEDEYSIWPANRDNALGWNDVGKQGSKEECTAYAKEAMMARMPAGPTLRQRMEEERKRREESGEG